jgi:predicted lipoprotein with Yx(FWY)xxD motif
MKQTDAGGHIWMRTAIAVIAVGSAFALAACGDNSDDNGGATAAMGSGGETVSVESLRDAGDVLVDNDGAALYTPDQEANGKILCASADCTAIWKPVTVSGGSPT